MNCDLLCEHSIWKCEMDEARIKAESYRNRKTELGALADAD